MPDPPALIFNAPPGWPVPDAAWQERFAGWRPVPGWRLDGAAEPAPAGWRFWSRGPGWRAFALPTTRAVRERLLLRAVIGFTGLVGTLAFVGRPGTATLLAALCGGTTVLAALAVVRGTRTLALARRMLLDSLHDLAEHRMTTGRPE